MKAYASYGLVVFSENPDLARNAGYHFDEMENDPDFTGWTLYLSFAIGGTEITVVKVSKKLNIDSITDHIIKAASIIVETKEESEKRKRGKRRKRTLE